MRGGGDKDKNAFIICKKYLICTLVHVLNKQQIKQATVPQAGYKQALLRAAVFIYSVFTVCRERINEGFRKNKNVSDEAEIYKVSITFLNELSNIACFLIAKFFPEMISHSYFF